MKKIFALLLSAALVLSLTACASARPVEAASPAAPAEVPTASSAAAPDVPDAAPIGEVVLGGWTHSESPAVTDELRAVLDKALEGFAGSVIDPVAYLGSQVVAGTDHCFLCQATVTYPGAQPKYVLVYVYQDLSGNASIMNIADLDIGASCEYGGVADEASSGSVQIADPFVDYATLAEAAEAAGFELTAPETVEGYDGEKVIQVMSGSMIQIVFHNSEGDRLFIRKEAGSEDISGDYNSYAEVVTADVDGCDVTLKGNDGSVSTAVWTKGGYSFAVTADRPMSAGAVTALAAQIA